MRQRAGVEFAVVFLATAGIAAQLIQCDNGAMGMTAAKLLQCNNRQIPIARRPFPLVPAVHRVHRPCPPRQSEPQDSRRQGRDRAKRGACGPLWAGGTVPKARSSPLMQAA